MRTSVKTTLGFVLACVVILFGIIVSNKSTSQFIDDSKWMVQAIEVRGELERVSALFLEAQNNIRAFHMTEQSYYKDLHAKAKDELLKAIAHLGTTVQDNEVQHKQIADLTQQINDRVELWNHSFEIHREGGWKAIQERMMAPQAKSRDLQLFATLDAIKTEEDRSVHERIAATERQSVDVKIIMWMSGVLATLLMAAATFMIYRDNRRREGAEENIDQFFDLSLDLLCISGMDGYFKKLSPSYGEVLGYSLDELYSRPILDFIHPDDVQKTVNEIEQQAAGNKVLSFENRFRTADGHYKTFSWKSVPVDGLMYGVARDVTQQKQTEAAMLAAREEAQKAAVVKSEFLANMSHEIRTPLNGVVGMTDLLARTNLDLEQKNFLMAIRTSATSLMKIVNEILDFSKIEAGQMAVDKTDFDLRALIEQQISLGGVLISEKNLRLESSVDPAIPGVLKGDSGKIGQVLLNLVNNAVKFTEDGTIRIKAEAKSVTGSRCELKISVQDSGIGMDPDQKARLFEPFVQGDGSTARRFGGTGLGLSICRRLVELMGGQIWVESRPGYGSLFWFTLTLEVSELQKLPASEEEQEITSQSLTPEQVEKRKKIRILIAEDNRVNQAIIMGMITSLGYSPSLAKNGQEAVTLFEQSKYDMILMDQHMPVMDGLEASRQIRRLEESSGRRTPIIAFTATVIQSDQKEQYRNLMDDFILKPVTMDSLQNTLGTWEGKILSI